MKTLRTIGSALLFCVLAVLSLAFLGAVLSPSSSQVGGMAQSMTFLFYPVAAVCAMIGIVGYRLWKNRLFWALLAAVSLVIFIGSRMTFTAGDSLQALFVTSLLAPVCAVPLWQLAMAVSWGAKTWKG